MKMRRTARAARTILVIVMASCTDGGRITADGATDAASVKISPSFSSALTVGRASDVNAFVRSADGTILLGATVRWTSSDPTVAVVYRSARTSQIASVTALRIGTTTLVAESGSVTARFILTVREPGPPATIVLSSKNTVSLDTIAQLNAFIYDADGAARSDLRPTFSSSDSTSVQISSLGVITPLRAGTVTVFARIDTLVAKAQLRITDAARAFFWSPESGMMELATPSGFALTKANAVNDDDLVVGTAATTGFVRMRAVAWRRDTPGTVRELQSATVDGNSEALGVNNRGQVVGYLALPSGVRHAALWRTSGELLDLGVLPTMRESEAHGINDAGQVVGWSTGSDGTHAFIWTEATGMRALSDQSISAAFSINQSGTVAGRRDSRPILWTNSSPVELSPFIFDIEGSAVAVNDIGEAVGTSIGCAFYDYYYYYYDDCNMTEHAAFWPLSRLAFDFRSSFTSSPPLVRVVGINNRQQIAGTGSPGRAVMYSASTGLRDLGVVSGRTASDAFAINQLGHVVGWSRNP